MNEVTFFIWYMYNRWSLGEATMLFDDNLGEHIFNKWLWYKDNVIDYNLKWYSELDNFCKDKIYKRANEIYSKS